MRTNDIIIGKVKAWLTASNLSYQMLADDLGVSKSLIGHMLSGERAILPERIKQIANRMNIPVSELVSDDSLRTNHLTYQLRGNTSNRRSKRALEELLFAIEDYVAIKEQVKS